MPENGQVREAVLTGREDRLQEILIRLASYEMMG